MRDLQHDQDRHDAEPDDGVAMPAIATVRTIWSSQLFCAAPRSCPADGDQHCHQGGQQGDLQRHRDARGDLLADRPDHIDVPKSPRAIPNEVEELQHQRTVETELGVRWRPPSG
jgi:hypothetical protein